LGFVRPSVYYDAFSGLDFLAEKICVRSTNAGGATSIGGIFAYLHGEKVTGGNSLAAWINNAGAARVM
jgi:hypothetical protein